MSLLLRVEDTRRMPYERQGRASDWTSGCLLLLVSLARSNSGAITDTQPAHRRLDMSRRSYII